MAYLARVADRELGDALGRAGAVLIEGPRACEKTETALRRAASIVRVDDDPAVPGLVAVDPSLVLEGRRPRLLDEWQLHPQLRNAVRRAVDDASERGQFILTGSTAPASDAIRHSGAGRFARLRMRTLSLFESGDSDGTVSLAAILEGEAPRAATARLGFDGLLSRMTRGGWPGFTGLADREVRANIRDYASTVSTAVTPESQRGRDAASTSAFNTVCGGAGRQAT